ncbi:hypothetical protein FBF25_00815 [Candidatus Saccharibacteria bacterium oral taxon 488]|nr:hypothetical protein FBF25_00815 [Candidatus Saccharibacteria bacterium oral taxon 488]QLF51601.1 hypothetical protein HW277_00825 [Candidatus Saccharibacteria bacterium oral taxon 488]
MSERNIPRRGNTMPSAERVANSPEQIPAPNAAMQEFAGKFSSISEQMNEVVASKRATTKEYKANKQLSPQLVEKYGGHDIYRDKIVGYNQRIAGLQDEHRALAGLYSELGGDKIDSLKQELQDRTGGRARGTWSAEVVITERALRQAQDAFAKNYEDYKADKQKGDQTSRPKGGSNFPRPALPPGKKGPEGTKGPEDDGSGEDDPRPAEERISDAMTRMSDFCENTYEIDPNTGEKRYTYLEHIRRYEAARERFQEVMTLKQKSCGLRINPNGKLMARLLGCGRLGAKLADRLTRPSKEEQEAAAAYEAALTQVDVDRHNFLGQEIDRGNLTREEVRGLRSQFFTAEHYGNVQEIARLQMDRGKDEDGNRRRPMSKWLRRLGYLTAGAIGGVTAMFNIPLGIAVAGAGAGVFRGLANKRNANMKVSPEDKNPLNKEYKAEAVADVYHQQFLESMQARTEEAQKEGSDWEPGARDIVGTHLYETSIEAGKSTERLTRPVLGAVALAAAIKFSTDLMGSGSAGGSGNVENPKSETGGGDSAGNVPPTVSSETPPAQPHLTEVNTNGAPESVVGDQLQHLGYKLEGNSTEFLKKLADNVGQDKVFADANNNPVDMFTGKAGDQQFGAWNVNTSVRFSDEAVRAIEAMKDVTKV